MYQIKAQVITTTHIILAGSHQSGVGKNKAQVHSMFLHHAAQFQAQSDPAYDGCLVAPSRSGRILLVSQTEIRTIAYARKVPTI